MKKKLLILVSVLLLSSQLVSAQAAILALIFGDRVASEQFNLSLELGFPQGQVGDIDNMSRASGLNFGIAGNIKLSERWFLSPTAYFASRRSFIIDDISLNSPDPALNQLYQNTEARFTISYIDLPLFINYRMPSNWQVGVAPQVGFKQRSTVEYEGELGNFSQGFGPTLNNTEWGVVFQLAYFFKKARKGKGLFLSARYYQGLTDVFENTFATGSNRANYFSIHVGVPFITDELAAKNLE